MKKLLILLFISLAFLGSANANSINGAFGYKLGQVFNGAELYEDRDGFKNKSQSVSPVKPMPPFESFAVYTTLKQNKIYEITAYVWDIKMDNHTSCASNKYFYKLLDALENKYGRFADWTRSMNYSTHEFFKQIGDRQILLRCRQISGSFEDVSPNDGISIYLVYRDNKLFKLLREENNEFSDYDI